MKIKVVVFIILAGIGIPCLAYLGVKGVRFLLADYYLVATLKVDGNKKILIYEPSFQEATKAYDYEVLDGDKVVFPKWSFYYTSFDEKPQFEVIRSMKNEIVAVVDAHYPNSVLIIYDFSTGESWPEQGDHAEEGEYKKILVYFQEKLQRAFPQMNLTLNEEKFNRSL